MLSGPVRLVGPQDGTGGGGSGDVRSVVTSTMKMVYPDLGRVGEAVQGHIDPCTCVHVCVYVRMPRGS